MENPFKFGTVVDGDYFTDRTQELVYVKQVLDSRNHLVLISPRRFGKSLFLSTLAAYFRGQKELFTNLYIEKAEEEQAAQENRSAWQEYPVFYLDFRACTKN